MARKDMIWILVDVEDDRPHHHCYGAFKSEEKLIAAARELTNDGLEEADFITIENLGDLIDADLGFYTCPAPE